MIRTNAWFVRCCLGVIVIGLPVTSSAQGSFRWYFKKHVVQETVQASDTTATVAARAGFRVRQTFSPMSGSSLSFVRTRAIVDTKVWAGPSIGFDAFVRESGTGAYKLGVIPGVGYGVKWGKEPDTETKDPTPWVALDLFVQGALSEEDKTHDGSDYFNIDALPVVTVWNWVSIGYGPRFKVGLNGLPSLRRAVFSFGVRKAT